MAQFTGGHDRADPDLSRSTPTLATPTCLFAVGALDPLLDDSLRLAKRWRAAGNDAELAVFPDIGHELEPGERLHSFLASRLEA